MAGYVTAVPEIDRDSVDVSIAAGGAFRPQLNAQLKATIRLPKSGEFLKFSLKKKNYDDLRVPTMVPRILIVLALHKLPKHWVNVSAHRLIMRRCAYWLSLRDAPELPPEQATTTIQSPIANQFDVACLANLMDQARTGSLR
jgi:hypothetical protein